MDQRPRPGPGAVLPGRPAPPARTLLDVLDTTVHTHPDAPAIDDGRTALTYAGLAGRVDALADRLRAAGIGAGDRVGVRIPGGTCELHLAVLAVLSCGAAYVPVDAEDPAERAARVWARAGVCAVLGAGHVLTPLPAPAPGGTPRRPTPGDDAWVIFTSGTTGGPKGVATGHRAAAALVDAEARLFLQDRPIGPGDRVLAGLSVAFDASCEEMWLAWRHGACLVPAPRELVRAGAELCGWLVTRRVSVVSTVPTLLATWPADALPAVRLLVLGGEAVSHALARRWADPRREVWNTYGPTETTVVACAARLRAGETPRIGGPLDGWDLAVVDPGGEPVAWGDTGELVVGGVGLGRYLDPADDAGRFAPMPRLGWDRGYRTGDLVLADPGGLVFVGRLDGQLKIRGHRVEPAEIDDALESHPGVRRAHTHALQGPDGPRLVAHVVADGVTVTELRRHLAATVPAHLRPDHLVTLPAMPLTVSGKIDVRALPAPAPSRPAATPPADTEELVAAIWCEVLGVDDVDPDTGFLEIGGNSLQLAGVRDRLTEALGRPVGVVELFAHPTVRTLAGHLRDTGTA